MITVLPYGSDRPSKRFPAVTYALIAANIMVYLWSLRMGADLIVSGLGLTPEHPSFTTILTSMFLHVHPAHLIFNLLFLFLFGPNVEEALGSIAYTVFYFTSGFAAAFLHVIVVLQFFPSASDAPYLGASGAIAGILGIYAVRFYKTKLRLWLLFFSISIPAWLGLGVWFVTQLAGGMYGIISSNEGDVAYWSHIGGMAFGILLAYTLRMGRAGTKEYLMTDACHNLENGTTWGAVECLLSLLKRDPENPDVHYELGRTYAMQNNPVQAINHFRRSIEFYLHKDRHDKAIETFDLLRQYYPAVHLSVRTEFLLARHMIDAGDFEKAMSLLENIIECSTESPEAETAMVKMGDVYMNNLNNPEKAALWYERLLKEYPSSTYRAMVQSCLSRARGSEGNG